MYIFISIIPLLYFPSQLSRSLKYTLVHKPLSSQLYKDIFSYANGRDVPCCV